MAGYSMPGGNVISQSATPSPSHTVLSPVTLARPNSLPIAAGVPATSSLSAPVLSHTGVEKVNMASVPSMVASASLPQTHSPASQNRSPAHSIRPPAAAALPLDAKVLDKRRIQELVKEVDPLEQLDEEVEEVLMQVADDFIDNVMTASCQMAKHRKSNTVEVKDLQLHLERNWNMWIPGFGSEGLRPYKKAATTEAHKQRMALIRKTLKKY